MTLKEIEKKLRKELDKERLAHTLGVMYTAASLAMVHDVDMERAMFAGLLHDCAKCIPNDKKFKLCKKYKVSLTDIEKKCPFLIHAKLGAYMAKEVYGIQDIEILHAIEVHTTGVPQMNALDKIIYISDYIEPNRNKAPNLNKVRKLAFQDLDQAMLQILSDTLSYLDEGKSEIDPMTAETYEYFKKLIG